MASGFGRTGHAYTDDMLARAEKIITELRAMSREMKARGDEARAMDIDEAVIYVEGAVGLDP